MSATLEAHVAQRAEQSASLRQGIAISAGLHLTLAVLLFGALGVMRTRPVAHFDAPPDSRVIDILDPPGDPGAAPSPPPEVPVANAAVVPIDDDALVREREREIPVTPPEGEGAGPVSEGEPGNGSPQGGGIGSSGDVSFPGPNDPSFADIQPMVIRRVVPAYPDIPRQAGLEGKVWVRILVDPQGAVRKAEIEVSSSMFDEAALEAARQWTFRPAYAGGNPVAVWVRIPFDFRMK